PRRIGVQQGEDGRRQAGSFLEGGGVHARSSRRLAGGGVSARIAVRELEALMDAALARAGATAPMARATARALAAAEMEGIASHGASRIPQYCGHLRNGRATGGAVARVARDSKAAALVDAGGGLAFEACGLAIAEAVRRAREYG